MELKAIVNDSLKYPFGVGFNWLILSVITFIGLFIGFTSFFSNGYGYRIITSSLDGNNESPKFNNWISMFIDGVKVFIVGVGYAIPLILFVIIFFAVFVLFIVFFPNSKSFVGWVCCFVDYGTGCQRYLLDHCESLFCNGNSSHG